jgi:hypothetical protein
MKKIFPEVGTDVCLSVRELRWMASAGTFLILPSSIAGCSPPRQHHLNASIDEARCRARRQTRDHEQRARSCRSVDGFATSARRLANSLFFEKKGRDAKYVTVVVAESAYAQRTERESPIPMKFENEVSQTTTVGSELRSIVSERIDPPNASLVSASTTQRAQRS